MPAPSLGGQLTSATTRLRGGARVMCCRTWRRVLAASNPARVLGQLARTQLGASSAEAAALQQLTAAQARLMAMAMTLTTCPKAGGPFGAGVVRIPTLDPYVRVTLGADRGVRVRVGLPQARGARRAG